MRRWDCRTVEDVSKFLGDRAVELAKKTQKNKVVIIGDDSPYCLYIKNSITDRHNLQLDSYSLEGLYKLMETPASYVCCIICTYPDSRRIAKAAQFVMRSDGLDIIPFEYVLIPSLEYEVFLKHDGYKTIDFVSPLLIQDIPVFQIYEESLRVFEKKCGIRDYMDICQLLRSVLDNSIRGDVAEFGSYKGHSGYLIARLLSAMGSTKHLYMFDTFERFPDEPFGVDKLWSESHWVDFNDVNSKFKDMPNVTLVKGDFTSTFKQVDITKLSLVYVDCDSYRASRYIIEKIYPNILSKGGVMIFEDYGHAVLLGQRLAFHEFFDGISGCMKFFSQFSGMYIVSKL